MNRAFLLFLTLGLLLLNHFSITAQPEKRIVPRHPYAVELPELGRMIGLENDCLFGESIYPIGDCNGDGIDDWIVTRRWCDTVIDGKVPTDLLLYKGVRNGLPDPADRQRIGALDIAGNVIFQAAGDWDGDSYADIATSLILWRDTTFGPSNGKGASHLVIWWGNSEGTYSIADTTHLQINMDGWAQPDEGFAQDLNSDGIPDLMLSDVKGVVNGVIEKRAPIQVWFGGKNQRWGKELSRLSSWSWWTPPRMTQFNVFDRVQWIDQDADGLQDLIWYEDGGGGGKNGTIWVIYGKQGVILDTANIVEVKLDSAWGKYALFADITGDRVPELLINTGGQEVLKAYVGFPGQRIEEQYGTGNEPAHPGQSVWWGKPWAAIPLPGQLHDGWAAAGWSPIFDFGDGGLDGVGDLWVATTPDIVCYQGGKTFDSLYEGYITIPGGYGTSLSVVNLGDITGEEIPTYAIRYVSTPSGVMFVQPTSELPPTGRYRQLPPGTDTPITEVAITTTHQLGLQVVPNPSSGEVVIRWDRFDQVSSLVITDVLGQAVLTKELEAGTSEYRWEASETFGGRYFVTIRTSSGQQTQPIEVRP